MVRAYLDTRESELGNPKAPEENAEAENFGGGHIGHQRGNQGGQIHGKQRHDAANACS